MSEGEIIQLGVDLAVPGTDHTVLIVGGRRHGKTAYLIEQLSSQLQNESLPTDKGAALELAAKALSKAFGWSFDKALESVSFAAKVAAGDTAVEAGPTEEEVRMRWCGKPEPTRDDYDRGLISADIAAQEARHRALRCGEVVVDWMIDDDDDEESNSNHLVITDADAPALLPPWPSVQSPHFLRIIRNLGLAKGSGWDAVDAEIRKLQASPSGG